MINYILLEYKTSLDRGIYITNNMNKFLILNRNNIHLHLYKSNGWPFMYFSEINLLPESNRKYMLDGSFTTDALEILDIKYIKDLDLWFDEKFCEYVAEIYGEFRYSRVKTPKICSLAVKKNSDNLKHIEDQNDELCINAVSQKGTSLEHVKHKTEAICWKALESDINAYDFIDNPSLEMQLYIIKKVEHGLSLIKNQTQYLCDVAIETWPSAITYVINPSTESLLKKKLEYHGYYIYNIPEPTGEMVLSAIKSSPFILGDDKFKKFITSESLIPIIEANSECLQFIDDQTFELCERTTKRDPFSYRYIRSVEHKEKLRDIVYDTIRTKYSIYNYYVDVFKFYKNISIKDYVNKLFSCFTIEDINELLFQKRQIYQLISNNICNYKYDDINDFFKKYGVNYANADDYMVSLTCGSIIHEHYKLLRALSFNKTDIIMEILSGNLNICDDIDIDVNDILNNEFNLKNEIIKYINKNQKEIDSDKYPEIYDKGWKIKEVIKSYETSEYIDNIIE